MNSPPQLDRLRDLLADEAVFGLRPIDRDECDELLNRNPSEPAEAYDQSAAAYYLAAAPLEFGSIPQLLRRAVLSNYEMQLLGGDAVGLDEPPVATSARQRGGSPLWFTAVAASLLIGFLIGRTAIESGPQGGDADKTLPRQSLQSLLASGAAVTRVAWTVTEDPAATAAPGDPVGEVVWSDAKQEGYMTFRGLAANDPTKEQYQLWIFDAERDDAHPVDGGVFDIPVDADEAVVVINAKISVTRAVMFAITVEKPGGVVVSNRSRLPLLAKVD